MGSESGCSFLQSCHDPSCDQRAVTRRYANITATRLLGSDEGDDSEALGVIKFVNNLGCYLNLTIDKLQSLCQDSRKAHWEAIFMKLNKLESDNGTKSNLMADNNDEVKNFHEYVEEYGDYRIELAGAVTTLEQSDTNEGLILEAFENEELPTK
ncbi:hypothetical protein RB195_005723 [Necator americanus]|uniref:Uncharacterized protein n=1 Tax=Necator americanus TaxID=51031 RepID=A0ABR1BPC5_NECAM